MKAYLSDLRGIVLMATWMCVIGMVSSPLAAAQPAQAGSNAKAQAGAKAPTSTPRTPAGHPDLNGIWLPPPPPTIGGGPNFAKIDGKLVSGNALAAAVDPNDPNDDIGGTIRGAKSFSDSAHRESPVYKAEFQAKVDDLDYHSNQLDPAFNCVPRGVPRMGPPQQIIQSADRVVLLYGGSMNFRLIPLNKPHNKDVDPSLMGDSVGRWEGDTLVVDTNNFDDLQWLGSSGLFHTVDMHVIERFTRNGNGLTYEVSVEDTVFAKPWVRTRKLQLTNDKPLLEDAPCLNMDSDHLVNFDHD